MAIRILHLTDFHLNQSTLKDWDSVLKQKFLEKVKEIHTEQPISFIAFTGDLIDQGGKEFGGAAKGFEKFESAIIEPILSITGLQKSRFLMVPGNHDIERAKDSEREELGNRAYFRSEQKVLEFMRSASKENNFSGMQRIKEYKEFERNFYPSDDASISSSIFGSNFKINADNYSVGICCLNSAWRCYDKNDKGQIIIGEDQLNTGLNFINNCEVKIALLHHPLDWLSEVERSIVSKHITKEFDLLFVGHMHENMTAVQTGFSGSLFTSLAPSGLNDLRTDSKQYSNGFGVIDYSKATSRVNCTYYKYDHQKKEITLNTDDVDTGKHVFEIPNGQIVENENIALTAIQNIKEDHFAKMDEHLIGQKAEKVTYSIKEAFILPPIDLGNASKQEESSLEFTEAVKSKYDFMFFGAQETGKTTLLYRLVREYVDEFQYLGKVPVYINFAELGTKDIRTAIKEYTRCSSKEIEHLLNDSKIVLLVDNLNYKIYKDTVEIKNLEKFHKEFNTNAGKGKDKELRILASSENEISGILPIEHIDSCKIPFQNYFIRTLKAKEIKSLMGLWLPDEDKLSKQARLEKMLNDFTSFALPSTAMSVSLYLWSDSHERKPINHAVLLENYLEILLQKLSKENIYRDRFDFTNKVQLLAKIAQEMLIKDELSYSLDYIDFVKVIDDYLKKLVGFDFEADKIVEYFLNRKLFVRQNNKIKFTYSCYFHFFLAKRMEHNTEFKEYVMQESKYFNFHREIDYYTALRRNDKEVFKTILERFEQRFAPTDFILETLTKDIGIDRYFTPLIENKPHEPIAKHVPIQRILDNRPSEETRERYENKRLENIPNPTAFIKKDNAISLDILLVIMSNVLRNSEGVEDRELKSKAYKLLVKYNLIFSVLYRENIIDYVVKNKKLPPTIQHVQNLDGYLKSIPYLVQYSAYYHLGTSKLAPIILEKITLDKSGQSFSKSDIEKFFSIALYSDVYGKEHMKYLKGMIRNVGSNVVRDYLFFKLTDYLYKRTKPDSEEEEEYIDLLAELRIRTQGLARRIKETVLKELRTGRKILNKSSFKNTKGKGV